MIINDMIRVARSFLTKSSVAKVLICYIRVDYE